MQGKIYKYNYEIYLNLHILEIFPFKRTPKERVTHLYFTKNICEVKLKANPEVLIMDCTNKYRLLLLNVVGTTCLNTTFYAAFGFLLQEWIKDFTWSLKILRTLYRRLNLGRSKSLYYRSRFCVNGCEVFPHTENLLCL